MVKDIPSAADGIFKSPKTTTLRALASLRGVEVIDLDDLATRDAVAADPGTFVAGPPSVCIDEYQHVPVVLDAIKAELNRDGSPGRFAIETFVAGAALYTGSRSYLADDRVYVLPVDRLWRRVAPLQDR